MASTDRHPILVGIDGSFSAEWAAGWAAKEAELRGSPLNLVNAYAGADDGRISGSVPPGARNRDLFLGYARDCLREAAARARQVTPGVEVTTEVVAAHPVELLSDRSAGAELIVLGSRGLGGLSGLLLGSVAVGLISHAHCPVIVIRGDGLGTPADDTAAPVVVGVDESARSKAALDFAYEHAALHRAPLVALHAWVDTVIDPATALLLDTDAIREDESRLLAEHLAGWRERYPDLAVGYEVAIDRPAHALLEAGKRARLLVVGARGRGGMAGLLLGSTSQALAQRADCPVAVVRGPADPR